MTERMDGDAAGKYRFQRPVRGCVSASPLMRHPALCHDDHLVGVQSKGDLVQHADYRLALLHQRTHHSQPV